MADRPAAPTILTMTFPTVTELPQQLEPLTPDHFAIVVASDARPAQPLAGSNAHRLIVD